MDPQADNDAEPLKRRLNQPPLTPPSAGGLTVPASDTPAQEVEDIDDSAYAIGADTPQRVAQPVVPLQPLQPPQTMQPILPAPAPPAPSPAPVPVPTPVPVPAPVAPVPPMSAPPPAQPAPQPTPPPLPSPPVPMPPPPAPVLSPQPIAPPTAAASPPLPPATTQSTLAPKPVAAVSMPASVASYEPPTRHVAAEVVERIDETPQQNSKDIEALIEHNHRLHRLKGFASFIVFVVGVVIAAFLINSFIFQSYYVDGTSMTPTLQNNDRLIIDKIERTFAGLQGKPYVPQRGQIVVLDSSIVGINGRDEQLIKRVIGLPGDTVSIRDGAVTIKNAANPDGFDVNNKLGLKLQPTFVDTPMELNIPDGQVFVMGDNRIENGSYDSRAFGPIEVNKIVGRLWARILPVDKAQLF
ncbi:MAG TPA: signal peptidase I [Candidatus Saccharimonadales bacterium]|nr:signal peptidase I [Candidatus Saccharimonadales bacterium]